MNILREGCWCLKTRIKQLKHLMFGNKVPHLRGFWKHYTQARFSVLNLFNIKRKKIHISKHAKLNADKQSFLLSPRSPLQRGLCTARSFCSQQPRIAGTLSSTSPRHNGSIYQLIIVLRNNCPTFFSRRGLAVCGNQDRSERRPMDGREILSIPIWRGAAGIMEPNPWTHTAAPKRCALLPELWAVPTALWG